MKRLFYILFIAVCSAACSKDSPSDGIQVVNPEEVEHAVLIYAVNNSNLSSDLTRNIEGMLKAMSSIDNAKYQLLLFRTDSDTRCGLYSIVKDKSGNACFEPVRSYSRDMLSTDPVRIQTVIGDASELYPNAVRDLIFWGHGTSWIPEFSSHEPQDGPQKAYGGEYNPDRYNTDWTDIGDLADAVPDGAFRTIWFDCCYMAGIEVAYEFRNKCSSIVAYPTEIMAEGMPYDLTLNYILSEKQDLAAAAKSLVNYFDSKEDPATVTVISTAGLEGLAEAASAILASGPARPVTKNITDYSTSNRYSFYDFKQYLVQTASLNSGADLCPRLEEALRHAVVYHAATPIDFNFKTWNADELSGLSIHDFSNRNTDREKYYMTLDWYKRVY